MRTRCTLCVARRTLCTLHACFQERNTTPLCFENQHPKSKTRARTSTHASSAANNREDMRSERTKLISTKAPLCHGMEVDTRQNLKQKRRPAPPSAAQRRPPPTAHPRNGSHPLHSEAYAAHENNSPDLVSVGLLSIWMAYWSMVASTIVCNGLLSARPLLTKAKLALWRSPLGR